MSRRGVLAPFALAMREAECEMARAETAAFEALTKQAHLAAEIMLAPAPASTARTRAAALKAAQAERAAADQRWLRACARRLALKTAMAQWQARIASPKLGAAP